MMPNVENRDCGANELLHVSAREAFQLLNSGAVLIDTRLDYELSRLFDVEQIIYCPYDEIKNHLMDLPADKPLIIADAVGLRSKEVSKFLTENGFSKIYNLAGGIVDWDRAGFPVTTDKTRMLTGSCMCQLKNRNNKPK
jgi:rhodanese-related sulfurtransferase